MSSFGVKIKYAPLQSLDTSTLQGAYLPLGTPIPLNAMIIKMVNGSNVPLFISTEGVTDMDFIPPGSFFLYDESANSSREGGVTMAQGTQFYVKGDTGAGSIYLIIQHEWR
jgi:hypothetical protein